MLYGYWPEQIDHINHIKDDNRLENLREVTEKENHKNKPKVYNKTGLSNIEKLKYSYRVTFFVSGKNKRFGTYLNLEDAIKRREEIRAQLGYHENHGR